MAKPQLVTGDSDMLFVLQHYPDTEVLEVSGDAFVSDAACAGLSRLSKLQFLSLTGKRVTDKTLFEVGQLTRLERLYLTNTSVGSTGMVEVVKLKELKAIGLSGTRLGNLGMQTLKCLQNVEKFDASGTLVTDTGLEHLKGWSKLTHLKLDFNPQVTASAMPHLIRLPLVAVSLRRTGIVDGALAQLNKIASLRDLDVSDITALTKQGLSQLTGIAVVLDRLVVIGTGIKDDEFQAFLKGLKRTSPTPLATV